MASSHPSPSILYLDLLFYASLEQTSSSPGSLPRAPYSHYGCCLQTSVQEDSCLTVFVNLIITANKKGLRSDPGGTPPWSLSLSFTCPPSHPDFQVLGVLTDLVRVPEANWTSDLSEIIYIIYIKVVKKRFNCTNVHFIVFILLEVTTTNETLRQLEKSASGLVSKWFEQKMKDWKLQINVSRRGLSTCTCFYCETDESGPNPLQNRQKLRGTKTGESFISNRMTTESCWRSLNSAVKAKI